ncbi:MAG: ABC transporter permease [Beijerinckiaceae bacterium]
MIDSQLKASSRKLIVAARVQGRVIRALMLREAVARFGHENLGFFWLFIEPLLLGGAVALMWTFAGLHNGQGVGIVPFALASYSMLTLWRHICSQSIRVLHRNANLLFHRNVKVIDVLIAQVSLESIAGMAGFTIAFSVMNILGIVGNMEDPLAAALGWILMAWFGWSFSLVIAGLTELYEAAEHLVQPFLYLTLPLTGALYMVLWLPSSAQAAVMWSPLAHLFEMFRSGLFGQHMSAEWSVPYVVAWCLGLMAIGLPLLRIAQARFVAS